jgi:hypothetical protein
MEMLLCSSCITAEELRDKGLPEEVFYHCYEEQCSCGCYQWKKSAIGIAKDWYIQKVTKHTSKVLGLSKKE